jgi:dTDP-4-dehydrorhamnose reductase
MRIHITGSSGFLGCELVRQRPDATTERADVRDPAAVATVVARCEPDVVIHTAYRQGGDRAWAITADGTANVAAAAGAVGARLIHVSTDVVFNGHEGAPYREDAPVDPITDYGRAKAAAESHVATHPNALVVRTSLIVAGPGREPPSKYERAASDPEGVFYVDELRSPIAVADLAAALLEVAALDVTGVLHVAGPDHVSRAELAELIVGHPVRRAPAPADRPRDCRLDTTRARAILTTRVRGVRELYSR